LSKTVAAEGVAAEPGLGRRADAARQPAFAGTAAKQGHLSARAVGSFVPRLTRKAFEKYGFAAATLLTDWPRIVGPEVARYAQPERIKWPKGVVVHGDVEPGAEGRPGATLVLKVDPASAMDVEYRRAQLIERINCYFGYRAIVEIRLVQAMAPTPAVQSVPVRAAPDARREPPPELAAVTDDALRNALAAMKASIDVERAARR